MGNLSVSQTRGHSSHKWLLVFSTVGLCGLLTPIQKQLHLGHLHEADTVALEEQMKGARLEKVIPVHSTPSKMVVVG